MGSHRGQGEGGHVRGPLAVAVPRDVRPALWNALLPCGRQADQELPPPPRNQVVQTNGHRRALIHAPLPPPQGLRRPSLKTTISLEGCGFQCRWLRKFDRPCMVSSPPNIRTMSWGSGEPSSHNILQRPTQLSLIILHSPSSCPYSHLWGPTSSLSSRSSSPRMCWPQAICMSEER